MICKGIYEVLTPSVRLSRFATHVETGRPRKSQASIHGDSRERCKRAIRAAGRHGKTAGRSASAPLVDRQAASLLQLFETRLRLGDQSVVIRALGDGERFAHLRLRAGVIAVLVREHRQLEMSLARGGMIVRLPRVLD